MKKLIVPALLGIIGASGGVGAGLFYKNSNKAEHAESDASETEAGAVETEASDAHGDPQSTSDQGDGDVEYAKLNNQFVVPVVEDGKMAAMIIIGLSVEVPAGQQQSLFEIEPKLRDALFSTLLNHATLGGFSADFTSPSMMRTLRDSLNNTAHTVAPGLARSVLILEIARQDM